MKSHVLKFTVELFFDKPFTMYCNFNSCCSLNIDLQAIQFSHIRTILTYFILGSSVHSLIYVWFGLLLRKDDIFLEALTMQFFSIKLLDIQSFLYLVNLDSSKVRSCWL